MKQGVIIAIALVLSVILIFVLANYQIEKSKREFKETATKIVDPQNVDKAAKATGQVIHQFKSFKTRVTEEVQRLEDSTGQDSTGQEKENVR